MWGSRQNQKDFCGFLLEFQGSVNPAAGWEPTSIIFNAEKDVFEHLA